MSNSLSHDRYRRLKPTLGARGFTLIEVMIVVAIVAILSAIAIPSYRDYVLRGHLVDGTNALATMRADMERYFQDNRRYDAVGAFNPPCAAPGRVVGHFTVICTAADLRTYSLEARGAGPVNGFVFTLDQQGNQGTPNAGVANWGTSATCWVVKRGQTC